MQGRKMGETTRLELQARALNKEICDGLSLDEFEKHLLQRTAITDEFISGITASHPECDIFVIIRETRRVAPIYIYIRSSWNNVLCHIGEDDWFIKELFTNTENA
jgi:hypothetical protein